MKLGMAELIVSEGMSGRALVPLGGACRLWERLLALGLVYRDFC